MGMRGQGQVGGLGNGEEVFSVEGLVRRYRGPRAAARQASVLTGDASVPKGTNFGQKASRFKLSDAI